MGLKRVTGNNKRTQRLQDVEIASAVKASNQTNPRSGGTTLVETPRIAPTVRAEHHNTADVHFVVSTPTSLTDTPAQSTGATGMTGRSAKETSEQLTLLPYRNTTSSVADFLARASVSLATEGDSPTYGEHYSMKYAESLGLKELRIFGLKMFKDYCLLHIQKLSKSGVRKISMPMENLPELPSKNTRLCLELKDGFFSQYSTRFGNLGMTVNGKCLTARISVSHKTGSGCSLSDILEPSPDPKYFLSEKQTEYIEKQMGNSQTA